MSLRLALIRLPFANPTALRIRLLGLLLFPTLLGQPLSAQICVGGQPLQIHGFVSEGFAYSNDNNYLTVDTDKGSFAVTDAGFNVSTQVTDKFRLGAQAYLRSIGKLGSGHVTLDWASGDYRFTNWLGVRAGKVKTVLGLYNDTQDAEFLYTWALLPQSIYPLDLRDTSIAHLGGDVYGTFTLHQFGDLSYTAYSGSDPQDRSGGYVYGLQAGGINPQKISGTASGADLKWTTPLQGLVLGTSFLHSPRTATALNQQFGSPETVHLYGDHRLVFSGQYTVGNLRVEGEYSRELQKVDLFGVFGPFGPPSVGYEFDQRAWYESIAYRFSKHLELGTYNSRFLPNAGRLDGLFGYLPPAARHIYDQVFTARIDLTRFWDFKIEGHFIDGYGDPSSFRGFYPQDNPAGFQPKTNLLILRMGVNF